MKHIVVFGAGKSSTALIDYLINHLASNDWTLTVLDADLRAAEARTAQAPRTSASALDVNNTSDRKAQVALADLVISLLPAALHYLIATDCIEFSKNLLTASYIDAGIEQLRSAINDRGLLFLCEMGLDPGIDHMSAMHIIHSLQQKGAAITSFYSHCGGLVAPESDDNPWRYKISWNPRNVVLAGKAGADFKEKEQTVHMKYAQLFDADRQVQVDGLGTLSYYPNRDSLSYIDLYQLHHASDFVRTTLRFPEFCAGWKAIVDLQLTDETTQYDTDGKTLRNFFRELVEKTGISPELDTATLQQLIYLGLNDNLTVINKGKCTAADVMQFVLESRLALKPDDKDMVVMLHEIRYVLNNEKRLLRSTLLVKGENNVQTAMAKTVGLPLAIAARLILQQRIVLSGLHIPIISEIYKPVLAELEQAGVRFTETDTISSTSA